ncbi:MAG: hypothetical protein MK185_10025 [Saccharospirillaceae bacterium]|nr:hypothetical protein A3759_22785 [Thalassolituus sp. HI0120]KZZ44638.1 hypothetical protein A3759_11150 [Thalassolituus sp. HI0120]MCH2040960.1 hypothetical protein [Saccharospirillaceae bacterium]
MKWPIAVLVIALVMLVIFNLNNDDLVRIQLGADVSHNIADAEPLLSFETDTVTSSQVVSATVRESDITPRADIELDQQAIASFRDSVENGDPRAPALNRTRQRDEEPSAEELADPQRYEQYERRQQLRVYRAYVEASKSKIAELEKMIERGQREGVDDEQIAFARNKIQGIQEMAEELKREYPDIMEEHYAPGDDWLTNNLGIEDPQDIGNSN